MSNKSVTMQDVADLAGVSKSAVSLAFNDASKLSGPTLQTIMDAAKQLGYSRDPAARMLRTRRTHSLGLLLPQQLDRVLENPYYTQFLQGVGSTCYREGLTLLLAPPLRGSMLKSIPYAAVDGFIVSGLEYDRGEVSALHQRGIPFVLVDSDIHDGVPSVEIDEAEAMGQVISHLLDLGHRRITILALETGVRGGPPQWRGPMKRRAVGIESALERVDMSFSDPRIEIFEVPCTRQGGFDGFHLAFETKNAKPTAIVAFSDVVALGVLDAARASNIQVPTELSVTGFDDLNEASFSTPALTTIRQPIETKGRLAAEFLVEAIASSANSRPHYQKLHASLLVRDSTARVADTRGWH